MRNKTNRLLQGESQNQSEMMTPSEKREKSFVSQKKTERR